MNQQTLFEIKKTKRRIVPDYEWAQKALGHQTEIIYEALRGLRITPRTIKEISKALEGKGMSFEESHVRASILELKRQKKVVQSQGGNFSVIR